MACGSFPACWYVQARLFRVAQGIRVVGPQRFAPQIALVFKQFDSPRSHLAIFVSVGQCAQQLAGVRMIGPQFLDLGVPHLLEQRDGLADFCRRLDTPRPDSPE